MLVTSRKLRRVCTLTVVLGFTCCVESVTAQDAELSRESSEPGLLSSFFGPPAIGLELGKGSSELESVRIFLQSHWRKNWFDEGRWYLTGYWELNYGRWETKRIPVEPEILSVDSLEIVGFSPALRIMQKKIFSLQTKAYLEGAVGFHYLTEAFIGDRNVSSRFQFGDHVGLGVIFGEDDQFDLSYRLQHYSNGGYDSPNPGLDFHQFRLAVYF